MCLVYQIVMEGQLEKVSSNMSRSYYFVLTKVALTYFTPAKFNITGGGLVPKRRLPTSHMSVKGTEIEIDNAFVLLSSIKVLVCN